MTAEDDVTPDDAELRTAIMGEQDPQALIARIHHFYSDRARADRTPRETLYLHLGLLSGTIMRLLNEVERR